MIKTTATVTATATRPEAGDPTLKDRVHAAIEEQSDHLVLLSHDIHEHPEIAFSEEYAADRISKFLADQGFAVRTGVYGLPTAFIATIGNGPLHMAFCAEYDALPPACLGAVSSGGASSDQNKLGLAEVWLSNVALERSEGLDRQGSQDALLRHACGHNLIAGAAIAAAIGLREIAEEVGLTVSVFGTPGEELCGLPEPPEGHLAGGKVALLEAGAFEGVHALLMIHPGPTPWSMFYPTHVYLRQRARFSYGQTDVGTAGTGTDLRKRTVGTAEMQFLKETLQRTVLSLHQVPALFVALPDAHTDGQVHPENTYAQADLLWIAASSEEGKRASEAVRRCFEKVANSLGVDVEITEYAVDGELYNDPMLSASYRENSRVLGRTREHEEQTQEEIRAVFSSPDLPLPTRLISPLLRLFPRLVAPPGLFMDRCPAKFIFGTDLAPVSEVIPCIQPLVGVGGMAGVHSEEFAEQADTEEAYRAMLDAGVALAWTALDAATDPALRAYLLGQIRGRQG